MYERGLQALQRRDFAASADALRTVIERYPDERELLERARLYLKVCERELEPKEPAPKTADEWVYAATVALNAGDEAAALLHLQRALAADARHDHAHYMMAVASARRGDVATRARSSPPRRRAQPREPLDRAAGSRARAAARQAGLQGRARNARRREGAAASRGRRAGAPSRVRRLARSFHTLRPVGPTCAAPARPS